MDGQWIKLLKLLGKQIIVLIAEYFEGKLLKEGLLN